MLIPKPLRPMEPACDLLLYRTRQETWKNGQRYEKDGKVQILNWTPKLIEAIVSGTKDYSVKLEPRSGGLSRKCSCPVNDFCKHMVAVAITWDKLQGLSPPSTAEIEDISIPPPLVSYSDIQEAYKDSLNANLDTIRIAADEFGFTPRPHARLPNKPNFSENELSPVTLLETKKAFSEIKSWSRKYKYDWYFCAGEMVAAYCEVIRAILKRADVSNTLELARILRDAQKFHYILVQELIDDSDGLHEFTEAHLNALHKKLKSGNMDHKNSGLTGLLKEFEEHKDDY